MTAVGFGLYMLGRLIWEATEDDEISQPLSVIGFCLVVMGLTKFFWRVLP